LIPDCVRLCCRELFDAKAALMTRRNTAALLVAALVLSLIMMAAVALAAGASQIDETLGIVTEMAANAVSVIFGGFGVAAYGMLRFPARKLTEVFE